MEIPCGIFQYPAEGLARSRCQKLCWMIVTDFISKCWMEQNWTGNPEEVEVMASLDLRDKNSPHRHSCEVLTKKLINCDHCCSFTYFHLALWEKQVYTHACKPVEIEYDSPVYTECIWNAQAFPNHMWLTGAMQIGFPSASKSVQYSKFWYTVNLIDFIYFLCEQI